MNEREPVRRYSTGITLTGPPHRAAPAVAWHVAYPMCALPGTPPASLIAYEPLPPEEPSA
jgi:hypothetical protein